jgi:hypothetical protein
VSEDVSEGVYEAAEQAPPHHEHWDVAMHRAVQEAAGRMEVGESRTFAVSFAIEVVKTNPGWINRYVVKLSEGG